jgi:hypothetical protein
MEMMRVKHRPTDKVKQQGVQDVVIRSSTLTGKEQAPSPVVY